MAGSASSARICPGFGCRHTCGYTFQPTGRARPCAPARDLRASLRTGTDRDPHAAPHHRATRTLASAPAHAARVAAAADCAAGPRRTARPTRAAPSWAKYVVAPTSRDVRPVRVLSTSGTVANPAARSATGTATLTRATAGGPADLAGGHTADRVVLPRPQQRQQRPAAHLRRRQRHRRQHRHVLERRHRSAAYPDVLTITTPVARSTAGHHGAVQQRRRPAGLHRRHLGRHRVAAGRHGHRQHRRAAPRCPSPQPVSTTQVRITVTKDQSTGKGEFTRINEVYPGLVPIRPARRA